MASLLARFHIPSSPPALDPLFTLQVIPRMRGAGPFTTEYYCTDVNKNTPWSSVAQNIRPQASDAQRTPVSRQIFVGFWSCGQIYTNYSQFSSFNGLCWLMQHHISSVHLMTEPFKSVEVVGDWTSFTTFDQHETEKLHKLSHVQTNLILFHSFALVSCLKCPGLNIMWTLKYMKVFHN